MPTTKRKRRKTVLRVSPFSTLPLEILTHIFTLISSGAGVRVLDNGPFSFYSLPYPAWLPITRVCRYWRTVALSHAQLWTSITPGLSIPWIKVFKERSRTMLIDFDFLVHPTWVHIQRGNRLFDRDIIQLLKGFTRVRSLHLTGDSSVLAPIINSLRCLLPIQSLSIYVERGFELVLPNDLFGGKASVRRLQFIADGGSCIFAPGWLLRGVTHFTIKMWLSPSALLNQLYPMSQSSLTHLEYWQPPGQRWPHSDMGSSPIQMPQLVEVTVHAEVPDPFILLNRMLLSHVDAKWRLVLYESVEQAMDLDPRSFRNPFDAYQIGYFSQIIEATNRLKQIQISGTQEEGWCRLWAGNSVTTWEDAKFCLSCGWTEEVNLNNFTSNFITTCDSLGAAWVHKLVIGSPYPSLPWWKLLGKLPGIEELELYSHSVYTIGAAWRPGANLAPAVLPALRKVRIVESFPASPRQYAILGDPPARKIVRLPIHAEDDVASSPDLESAEKELEDMSKGLLKLLRGLGRKIQSR